MNVSCIQRGQYWHHRLLFRFSERLVDGGIPDVARTLLYRKRFFGNPLSRLAQHVLRGPSAWSVADRELFGATTSKANQCAFCFRAHAAVAATALGEQAVNDAVDDHQADPFQEGVAEWVPDSPREILTRFRASVARSMPHTQDALRSTDAPPDTVTAQSSPLNTRTHVMMSFVEALTVAPESITKDDVRSLLETGIQEAEIRNAVYICTIFCILNRISNSLQWRVNSSPKYYRGFGHILYRLGYMWLSFL